MERDGQATEWEVSSPPSLKQCIVHNSIYNIYHMFFENLDTNYAFFIPLPQKWRVLKKPMVFAWGRSNFEALAFEDEAARKAILDEFSYVFKCCFNTPDLIPV